MKVVMTYEEQKLILQGEAKIWIKLFLALLLLRYK